MIQAADSIERYLGRFEDFDRRTSGDVPSWLRPIRRRAVDCFAKLGFPTTREEEWRFTDLAPLVRTPPAARQARALPVRPAEIPAREGRTRSGAPPMAG